MKTKAKLNSPAGQIYPVFQAVSKSIIAIARHWKVEFSFSGLNYEEGIQKANPEWIGFWIFKVRLYASI
jgi:hypothetical protein